MSFLALMLVACSGDQVETIDVPKTPPGDQTTVVANEPSPGPDAPSAGAPAGQAPQPPTMGQTVLPGMAAQADRFSPPHWSAPDHWEPQELGQVRRGSWLIRQDDQVADMAVTAFPGDVGGDLANINRWASQIGAPAWNNEVLAEARASQTITVDGAPALLVSLNGNRGQATRGVILPRDNATWFFKMQGDAELVASEAPAMDQFMASVHFH